ncbi:MAG TPA: transporter substrate-binding domain-containing protein [Syntrophomonas sp.]|jgi:polar amino acid transport system substrate-binding protein|nr:transporter substrate-binding domain-containing protein [Syntrophomonas sp.]
MKRILCVLLMILFVVTLGACSSSNTTEPKTGGSGGTAPAEDDLAYIKNKGTLVIGITEYEPMNYKDKDGKLVGFDTEYAEALCAKLGITPKFVFINWDTKEIELKSKNIDCIWNGLTIKEDRKQNMAFTQPYLINEQVVVIRSADAAKYADKASLKGASIVAESGSAGESAIKADLPDAKYTAVDAQTKALLEVKAGTAQAAVLDATLAKSMTGAGTDYADLTVIPGVKLTAEEYAIGLRLGSTAVAEFNKTTAELLQDGTLAKIAEKYGLTERLITK